MGKTVVGYLMVSGNSRPKIVIGPASTGIDRREDQQVSCKAVRQPKLLSGDRKRCLLVELRLSKVPNLFTGEIPEVYCSLAIAVGFAGISGSRAKVCAGCLMLVRSRKIAYRYVI